MSGDNKDKSELKDLMKIDYSYPDPDNDDLQYKLFKKREFYYHKIPPRPDMGDYNNIREFRDKVCARKFSLRDHQSFLSNFINPDTPYKGLLIFHGTGTGKCITKDQHVLINGNYMKIKDVWTNYKSNKIINDGEGKWSIPLFPMTVNALDKDTGKITNGTVIRMYKQKINEEIKKITLDSGKQLFLTNKHPLLVNGNWTNTFCINDYVAIPTKLIITKKYNQITSQYIENWNITCVNENSYHFTNNNNENNDFNYEKIISIENIHYDDYVYDLEVKDHHNFVAEGILCHNTCAAIAIAEKFKDMVQKYQTKIYVLVNGPLIRDNWRNELISVCTGETYMKYQDKSVYIDDQEKAKAKKNALNMAMQYYRFMSYRSFYKKVLGEKIVVRKTTKDNKIKVSYRKTDEGEFERDIAIDRIDKLDNTIIVVDEAHNLTGNAYGEALMKIIKNSHNLRIVLLSATPMKNLASDIVEMMNFIRPPDSPIIKDKIFSSDSNHEMSFKQGGLEYLKNMTRGYISYLRGADPIIFAERAEMGIRPAGLKFTKIIPCAMEQFQRSIYDDAIKFEDDTLDRRSEAVSNFVFPGLSEDRKSIIGYYGREGINKLMNQIKTSYDLLNKKIASDILKNYNNDTDGELLYISENKKTITGSILKMKYLKNFSTKFHRAMETIMELVPNKRGSRTAFVYSNLVKVGIELFQEVLLQNGWLEYDETGNYTIKPDTVCYLTMRPFKDYQDAKAKGEQLKDENGKPYPPHQFYPACFVTITGKTSDEGADIIPEEKRLILDNVFNNIENLDGKYIKLVLGSKVMNEGISLKNVSEVHILDIWYNLGRVDQVVGRAIRQCSHYLTINDNNKFPEVKVFKYAVSLEKGLSTEIDLYRKAELKHIMIKKVERAIKEVAIDCPLNRHGNIFREEIEHNKTCKDDKHDEITCPAKCDYTTCDFLCDDKRLNAEYYDPSRKIYKKISKDKLDYSTFTSSLARNEIDIAKSKIKDMYKIDFVYTLDQIVKSIKRTYEDEKYELFDEFFVYKALDELIPESENDFNNYRDTIIDKFNREGYLIYNDKNYIFQPFNESEKVPMYYRSTFNEHINNKLTLQGYLKNKKDISSLEIVDVIDDDEVVDNQEYYDFESVREYYDNRDEFEFVGIIDKEVSRRKNKRLEEMDDVFKVREQRAKILDKKRGTGIPSFKGAVCSTSKNKQYLEELASKINVDVADLETRTDICDMIKNKLLELEKYSRGKKKITYIMIPKNHPQYPFPYNLEDRVVAKIDEIKNRIRFKIDINVVEEKFQSGPNKGFFQFKIEIKHNNKLNEFENIFNELGAKLEKNKWTILIN